MSQITRVTISREATIQARQYEPHKITVELTADVHSGDSPEEVSFELIGRANAIIVGELAQMPFPNAKSMAADMLREKLNDVLDRLNKD